MKGDDKKIYFTRERFLILFGLIILIFSVWFFFFDYAECKDWDCFNGYLEDCNKVKFIGGDDMIFKYTVRGSSNSECEVDVKLLQGELNNKESIKLEMREMTCMLPKGIVIIPESDIGKCSGFLKEGLQDLIIKRLYVEIVQNLGRINLEVLEVSNQSI